MVARKNGKAAHSKIRREAQGEDTGLIAVDSPEAVDPGVFMAALAKHRHPARDRDPPAI